MADEKQTDELSQAELSCATENLKSEEQKENLESAKSDKNKVDILLKATGDAPIMKKKKWAVDAEKPIGWVMEFVKKYLKLEPEEKLDTGSNILHLWCSGNFISRYTRRFYSYQNGHPIYSLTLPLHFPKHHIQFMYVNQTFAPSPDQIIRNLYECFGTDGKLVLHYCKSQAWG